MKKVLIICPFAKPNVGGVEAHVEKLMSYLSKRKCKVTLIAYQPLTTKTKGVRYENKENIEILRVPWFGNGWFPKLEPYFPLVFLYLFPGLFIQSLLFYIRRHKEIDVIHAHGFIAAAITKILVKVVKKRCVVSTHAIYRLQKKRILALLVRWLLKDFDSILAVGEPSKTELIDIGLDQRKIKIHPNWINLNDFRPLKREECRKALNLKSTDFIVLFLGRLIEIKGVLLLLDVAYRTSKEIKFIFAGAGPLARTIQDAAETNNKVKFYGRLSDADIVKAYNAADVFVSPVLYDEGFAGVYLESLACGTPLITSKKGCLPDFLSSEIADLLKSVNTDTVLEKIEYYFEHRDLLDNKRNLCRRYAEKSFSEKNAEVILNSY